MFQGRSEEYSIVVFLNDNDRLPVVNSGVRIFTEEYTTCMFHNGITQSSKIHPDFLSSMGSLNVDSSACSGFYSEVVSREKNRIIVISPEETFQFENRVNSPVTSQMNGFIETTHLALVYVYV